MGFITRDTLLMVSAVLGVLVAPGECGVPKLDNLHIPAAMKKKVAEAAQRRSVEQFVEAAKNTGFFEHTDKTFATYLAEHKRFFALFHAPFSDECQTFLEGYKEAAESLVAEGFAANFSVRAA